MPVIAEIPRGAEVRVDLRAGTGNSAVSVVGSGWVGGPDKETQGSCLYRGQSSAHLHRERGALWLQLDINVPDDGGTIDVTVIADGEVVKSKTASVDTVWTYPVAEE